MTEYKMKFKTMSVHSGQRIDPQTGALTTPLYQSSTFSYFNAQAGQERFAGQAPGFIYSRFGNPTTAELEQKLAALEGADEALVVASGMAAVSAIMYALADSGDEVAYIGPSTAAPMPSSSRPSAAPASRSPPTRAIRRCWPTSAPPPRWYSLKP